MNKTDLEFRLEHLNKYAIIDEPCTVVIRNNSRLQMDDLYTADGHHRWIINLKAVSAENLVLIKAFVAQGSYLTYEDVGPLLMKGAIWEEQITVDSDLPSKGEEVIAVFGMVDEILRCTNITLIPREQPRIYLYACDVLDELTEFERIIQESNE